MAVHKTIPDQSGLFFITFTCWKWMNLFQLTHTYDAIYNWFDILRSKDHYIAAYVIMPNHLHGLFGFRNTVGASINSIVGNGKRFIAYEVLKRLQRAGEQQILSDLATPVRLQDKQRGKLHEVFEPSFDWRKCESLRFTQQKINYIHSNLCRGKWNLAESPWDYLHSSALFYHTGHHRAYEVMHYLQLEDMI